MNCASFMGTLFLAQDVTDQANPFVIEWPVVEGEV